MNKKVKSNKTIMSEELKKWLQEQIKVYSDGYNQVSPNGKHEIGIIIRTLKEVLAFDDSNTRPDTMRWVEITPETVLPLGNEILFDGEDGPSWATPVNTGKFIELLVYDSSGEEEYETVNNYQRYLHEPK